MFCESLQQNMHLSLNVVLGLLDLSAAFDTVDHDILLRRLATSFGISGLTLKWISSFLTGRTQAVVFRGTTSAYSTVKYGVPQGSILGPVLFLLYTADVTAVAGRQCQCTFVCRRHPALHMLFRCQWTGFCIETNTQSTE